jgi:hypothetical protein
MFKYLLLAATAVGNASALWPIVDRKYNWGSVGTSGVNVLSLGITLNAEPLTYGTTYFGGKNDMDATQYIAYGVALGNFINATMTFRVLNYWTFSPMASFQPISFAPYSQVVGW